MLFLHNDVVAELLTMEDCIRVQESAFRDLARGLAAHRPRSDIYAPCERDDGYYRWGTVEGYSGGYLAIRMKSDITTWPRDQNGNWTEDKHCIAPGTWCGLIMLFAARNGEPLAIINDGYLQHMRVGGSAGIGAKHLARKDASTVGLLGSGGMARTYIQAFCRVRPIRSAKVFSPTKANREAFAAEMSAKLNIDIEPVATAEESVRGADIVATCTSSMTPTLQPEWLEPGQHVTMLGPKELSPEVIARADVKITQDAGGLKFASTDAQKEVGHSPLAWVAGTPEERKRLPHKPGGSGFYVPLPDFVDFVNGRVEGRTSDEQITLYYNLGLMGLQFSSVSGHVYELAKKAGKGRELPTEWFLQDIRD
ncbi:MAG: Ornithine cyclodeaminase 2 [Pseudomonadota bacterium]|jgi:alanine dehydrogenase